MLNLLGGMGLGDSRAEPMMSGSNPQIHDFRGIMIRRKGKKLTVGVS